MKRSSYFLVFALVISVALAASLEDLRKNGFKVEGDVASLREVNIRVGKAKKGDIPFKKKTPIGKVLGGGTTRASVGREFVTTDRAVANTCSGPGFGRGGFLSPSKLNFCVGGFGPITISGPPLICFCAYRCGTFGPNSFCSFTCGGITLFIWGPTGFFSCSVAGTTLPALPGQAPCPGVCKNVCSA